MDSYKCIVKKHLNKTFNLHLMPKFTIKYSSDIAFIRNATQEDIDSIEWPSSIKQIYISNSFIDTFEIPQGIIHFQCFKCLKKIIVPDSIKYLHLSDNILTELEVPNTIENVIADHNYLEKITFRNGDPINLEQLDLSNNCLESLYFKPPSSLYLLDLRLNSIQHIDPDLEEYIRVNEECYI
jgi:hypothetical protein